MFQTLRPLECVGELARILWMLGKIAGIQRAGGLDRPTGVESPPHNEYAMAERDGWPAMLLGARFRRCLRRSLASEVTMRAKNTGMNAPRFTTTVGRMRTLFPACGKARDAIDAAYGR